MDLSYIPEGQHAVAPFFIVSDADGLIGFLTQAFGGREVARSEGPDGVVRHATVAIGDSIVMVGSRTRTFENSTHLYVDDVDAAYRRCVELGAQSISAPTTFPYGDRSAGVRDPFGNTWWIGTHLGRTA
jgi:uncharacterized glyoxalase superfamily protein PhnB